MFLNRDMQIRKVAFPSFLLGTSLYILLPTPDELFIYPVLGFFFSYAFSMLFVYGVLIAMVIYRGFGVACLFGALLTGGKPIYNKLKEKFKKKDINTFNCKEPCPFNCR
jgi:hypothetical protein